MRERKRVTIKDVARETGLALSTVSNALASKSLVKPETRALVVEAAERLGYRASIVARSLRAQRSFAFGVLIEDVANPSASAFVRGVEDVALGAGCTLLLANTDGDINRQIDAMRTLIDHQVDGLVLISQHLNDDRVQDLLSEDVPIVCIQRRHATLEFDYVGSDNRGGIVEALRYVRRIGHRRIGFVTGPLMSSSAQERLATFRETAAELAFEDPDDLVFEGRYSFEKGLDAAAFFAGQRMLPTCIFASNDVNALGLMQGLSERGIKVPEHVSVVGLDDIDLASLKAIDLTTIRLEKRAIGAAAGELLLKRIDDPARPPVTVILPTHLIVRGSTVPPQA